MIECVINHKSQTWPRHMYMLRAQWVYIVVISVQIAIKIDEWQLFTSQYIFWHCWSHSSHLLYRQHLLYTHRSSKVVMCGSPCDLHEPDTALSLISTYVNIQYCIISSSFICSVNIKQSCTAMQYSGAGQQVPRKDANSCLKKQHDMTTINQHYK